MKKSSATLGIFIALITSSPTSEILLDFEKNPENVPSSITIPLAHVGVSKESGGWLVSYGIYDEELHYVVIQGPAKGELKGIVRGSSIRKPNLTLIPTVKLTMPNGDEVELMDSRRIIQINDRFIAESLRPISKESFLAFLHSDPPDYNLSSLIAFAEKFTARLRIAEQGGAGRPAEGAKKESDKKPKKKEVKPRSP